MIAPHLVAEEKWWNVRFMKRSAFSLSLHFSPLGLCLWKQEVTSYRYKVRLFLFNIVLAAAAGYFFRRHNKYCESGSEFDVFAPFSRCHSHEVCLSRHSEISALIRTEAERQIGSSFMNVIVWLQLNEHGKIFKAQDDFCSL